MLFYNIILSVPSKPAQQLNPLPDNMDQGLEVFEHLLIPLLAETRHEGLI